MLNILEKILKLFEDVEKMSEKFSHSIRFKGELKTIDNTRNVYALTVNLPTVFGNLFLLLKITIHLT